MKAINPIYNKWFLMREYLILIPTYNERENIERLLKILIESYPEMDILVIDDHSLDGTIDVLKSFSDEYPNIQYIVRTDEKGLGTALIRGYREAIKRGYKYLIQMDADLQHDPSYISILANKLREGCDLVISSRYIEGGRIDGWSFTRRLISKCANIYARIILGIGVRDLTSGFRGFNVSSLKNIIDELVDVDGFAIQVETIYRMYRKGYHICETPFIFKPRIHGSSKLGISIILEFFIRVLKLRF